MNRSVALTLFTSITLITYIKQDMYAVVVMGYAMNTYNYLPT